MSKNDMLIFEFPKKYNMLTAEGILAIVCVSLPSHLRQGADIGCPEDEQDRQSKHLRVEQSDTPGPLDLKHI